MSNKEIVEGLLSALIRVGSKITSEKYILLVLSTLTRDLRREHEAFTYLEIGTTSFSSSAQGIHVDPGINKIDKAELGASLSVFLDRIMAPSGLRRKGSFKAILEYEMGTEIVKSLERIGVKIS